MRVEDAVASPPAKTWNAIRCDCASPAPEQDGRAASAPPQTRGAEGGVGLGANAAHVTNGVRAVQRGKGRAQGPFAGGLGNIAKGVYRCEWHRGQIAHEGPNSPTRPRVRREIERRTGGKDVTGTWRRRWNCKSVETASARPGLRLASASAAYEEAQDHPRDQPRLPARSSQRAAQGQCHDPSVGVAIPGPLRNWAQGSQLRAAISLAGARKANKSSSLPAFSSPPMPALFVAHRAASLSSPPRPPLRRRQLPQLQRCEPRGESWTASTAPSTTARTRLLRPPRSHPSRPPRRRRLLPDGCTTSAPQLARWLPWTLLSPTPAPAPAPTTPGTPIINRPPRASRMLAR
ncbi:hypothetical protein K505DRAFT_368619 [Melanomma pulvis-pyrius CBS 109.77]|uniref:Uncharacterized protein n=1 Tax=Melanomma pulvis-pyrius CBS 109.77 TaxID=1314802 RepID=A0A6A6WPH9_9PLEO|nr:hypothetical protein K505DRAFT_368619 [Melanomma pulvis-pyrius CBS 109.77]